MKKTIQKFQILILAIVFVYGVEGKAQTAGWSLLANTSGAGDEYLYESTVSASGEVYYSGGYSQEFSVGSTIIKSYATTAAYVGHVSASGNHDWAIGVGGNKLSFTNAAGLTVDPFGNLYFIVIGFGGVVGDTLHIGASYHKLLSRAEGISLIVKMDSLGNVLWTNEINAGSATPGNLGNVRMIADGMGAVYITGFFFQPQVFDTITIYPSGWDGNFLAKCSANGNFLWAKSFGCKGSDGQTFSINRNSQNDVFVSGGWEGDTLFVQGQFVVNPTPGGFFNTDRYIAKFNSEGNIQWLRREGSLDADDYANMAVMSNGDVICKSYLGTNPLTVNNTQTITGGPGWLFTKYNAQGVYLSSYKFPISSTINGNLIVDGDDLYVSANFDAAQISLGGVTLQNSAGILGTTDLGIFKLDTQYNVKWGVSIGNTESEMGGFLSYSASTGIVMSGTTNSSQLFVGADTINNQGLLSAEGMLLAFDILSVGISTANRIDNVKFFPNPASEFINVNFEEELSGKVEMKVINTSAKLMLKESFNASKQISLDVSSLPQGIYILEVKMGNKYSIKKFIKE